MSWFGVVKSVRAWRCPRCGCFEPRAAVRYYMPAPLWALQRNQCTRRGLIVAEALEVRLGEPHQCDQELTQEANGA